MIVRCYAPNGTRYLLPCTGIVSYEPTDDELFIAVQMSHGARPVLVRGAVAHMDRAFSAAAVSWTGDRSWVVAKRRAEGSRERKKSKTRSRVDTGGQPALVPDLHGVPDATQ